MYLNVCLLKFLKKFIHPPIFDFSGASDMRLKYYVDIQGEISEHRLGTLFDFTKKLQYNNMFLIFKFCFNLPHV